MKDIQDDGGAAGASSDEEASEDEDGQKISKDEYYKSKRQHTKVADRVSIYACITHLHRFHLMTTRS